MKQVYKIDKDGYYLKPDIIFTEEIPSDCIETQPPQGLYRAKWTGTEWVEDMSQEEIDALNNVQKEPTTDEALALAIAELDMQREIDKTENQLAIAELASTLMGGQ